jgi:hypothetical protein
LCTDDYLQKLPKTKTKPQKQASITYFQITHHKLISAEKKVWQTNKTILWQAKNKREGRLRFVGNGLPNLEIRNLYR